MLPGNKLHVAQNPKAPMLELKKPCILPCCQLPTMAVPWHSVATTTPPERRAPNLGIYVVRFQGKKNLKYNGSIHLNDAPPSLHERNWAPRNNLVLIPLWCGAA